MGACGALAKEGSVQASAWSLQVEIAIDGSCVRPAGHPADRTQLERVNPRAVENGAGDVESQHFAEHH